MSTQPRRTYRFVDRVDHGGRPEADEALDDALRRMASDNEVAETLKCQMARLAALIGRMRNPVAESSAHAAMACLQSALFAIEPPRPAAAPLVRLGQGSYQRDIDPDPRTGRLDIRA